MWIKRGVCILTQLNPDTCACIANYERNILTTKCRTHDTMAEMLAHNRSFSNPDRPNDRVTEAKKPQFQRR